MIFREPLAGLPLHRTQRLRATVVSALQLLPPGAVTEGLRAFVNDAVLRTRSGLARVAVIEEELPELVGDVDLRLFAHEPADLGPLPRGQFNGVELAKGQPGLGEDAPIAAGKIPRPGLVLFGDVFGHVVDEPAVVLDGIDLAGGAALELVARVGDGIPAGGDPGADGGKVFILEAESGNVEMSGAAPLKLQLPDAGAVGEAPGKALVEDAQMVLVDPELFR